jgi:hypothetical protein
VFVLPWDKGLQDVTSLSLRLDFVGRSSLNAKVATFCPTLTLRVEAASAAGAPGPAAVVPALPLHSAAAPGTWVLHGAVGAEAPQVHLLHAADSTGGWQTDQVVVTVGHMGHNFKGGMSAGSVEAGPHELPAPLPAWQSVDPAGLVWSVSHGDAPASDTAGTYRLEHLGVESFSAVDQALTLRFDKRYVRARYAVQYRLCLQREAGSGRVVAYGRWLLVDGAFTDQGVVSGVATSGVVGRRG